VSTALSVNRITRRAVMLGLGTLLLGCSGSDFDNLEQGGFGGRGSGYGEIVDNGHRIPAVDATEIDPGLLRAVVRYNGPHRPGTIVVDDAETGLGATKRRRATRFAEVYRTRCPGGTYVEFNT